MALVLVPGCTAGRARYFRQVFDLERHFARLRLFLGYFQARRHRTYANWRVFLHPRASFAECRLDLTRTLQCDSDRLAYHDPGQRYFLQLPEVFACSALEARRLALPLGLTLCSSIQRGRRTENWLPL